MNAPGDVWTSVKPGCMAPMFRHPWRLLMATATVASLAAGCSSSSDDSSESLTTSGPDATTPVDAAVPETEVPDPAATDTASSGVSAPDTAPGDPTTTIALSPDEAASLLDESLAASTAAGYTFETVVTAGGGLAMQGDGDSIGDGIRLTVRRDDAIVQYVVLPEGTWVKAADGPWTATDEDLATIHPIAALQAATSVNPGPADGGTVVVEVPSAALGFPGDAVIELNVTITDGQIESVQYDTTVQGTPASVLMTLLPLADSTEIVPPI